MRNPRFLRLLAISYLVKTLLVGATLWLAPELPSQALAKLRATFSSSNTP